MNTSSSSSPVIECKNLWKIFGARHKEAMKFVQESSLGKSEVRDRFGCIVGVQNVSFSVSQGEIFCIMGLSGSGKSTLIRHVNRLIEPTLGQVIIEGVDVNSLNARALRKLRAEKIGMVFQSMALMPHRTVRDNVVFSLEVRGINEKQRHEVASRAIHAVDLDGWDSHYPDELSGGMQQRVGLARAIAADPDILLMDEPFSALDPLIRRQLQDKFISLSAEMNKTTLFITHDLDEAIRIGDRIAIMKDGVLVQVGTPEEIVTEPADDYVRDFVGGISKLELVTAGKIMEPLEAYQQHAGAIGQDWSVARPEDNLNTLVDIAIENEHPILIQSDGKMVGVVTRHALLRGIQGRVEPVSK